MRLIDADALWMVTEGDHDYYERFEIDNAPTVDAVPLEDYKSMERTVNKLTKAIVDAVPVVRCKDCVGCDRDDGSPWCGLVGLHVDDDHYCAWGERREDDTVRTV